MITHLYAVLVSIRRGTIILHQMNIWASGKFRSLQKYRRGLSAVIHQVRSVVLPFQGLLNSFHLNRRTAAGRPRIRRSPHLDLRRDERHGDHGPQPDPARIKHATRLYINVPLRKHSTPNPLREKDAGKGRIINAATSLRINVPSDSTLQPSNKGPRKIYLNQYTALRSESDQQCSDVSRALPRKKFRVNPASNNGPQNCGYRRIQKKRSHIIP